MKEIKFDDVCNFFDKQREASEIADKFKYVLYGGSVGGGKSRWLRWYPLRYLLIQYSLTEIKGIRAGLFCEDYPALHDRHIARIQWEFPEWLGNYNKTSKEFILKAEWGSGVLSLRNLDDVSHYQSAEFALVAVDELTKNKKDTFDFLRTRMRWPGISDVRFIAGSNPGGIGHFWVKQLWMDKVYEPTEKEKDQFKFVSSRVVDNPYLDKSYTVALEGLPENLRKAFLDGNWDVFQGQFFTEWDRNIHTMPAFAIPRDWKRYRAIDHGGDISPTSCLWFAVDYDKRVYCYREYHAIDKLATNHAKRIKELSGDETISATYADPSMWIKSSTDGRAVSDLYASEGVNLDRANNDRINGWMVVREFFAKKEGMTAPRLQIFENCYNLIRTIPLQIHDEKKAEDLDTTGDDHDVDALRYFLASWFGWPRMKNKQPEPGSFEWEMEQNRKRREAKEYE